MDHPTANMRPQVGSGPQPQHPQYGFQPSHPQALLHPHAPTCPVATAAQTTCPHAGAPPGCAACQLFTHAEAAHNGWLQTLCICEAHNPSPRMNTPAGRHKLEEAVRRSGDRELVALSWARGTISSLAQIIDANLERVLQARVVAGRDSITEDDVRVVNEAGDLMACIMPHLNDTRGNFWINDKSLLIPVQDFGLPEALKRQRHPHAADRHSQQSRQAWLAFNEFERRVHNDLVFLDRERWYFERLVPEGERERLARDHAQTQQGYLNQKHEEAQKLAWASILEEDQLQERQNLEAAAQEEELMEDDLRMEQLLEKHEREWERLRQQQRTPSFALAVNGSSSSPFAATPTAPGISASEQHAGAQPRVTVPMPAPQRTQAPQQPNTRQPRIPAWQQRQQQPQQYAQQQPARPLVVNGPAAKPNESQPPQTSWVKTRTCEEVQARLKFLGQPPCSQAALQSITAALNAQAQQEEQRRREKLYMNFEETSSQTRQHRRSANLEEQAQQHMVDNRLRRAKPAQPSMAAALNTSEASDVRTEGMDDACQLEGKGKGKCEEKGKQQKQHQHSPSSYGLPSPSSRSENEWMDVVIEK